MLNFSKLLTKILLAFLLILTSVSFFNIAGSAYTYTGNIYADDSCTAQKLLASVLVSKLINVGVYNGCTSNTTYCSYNCGYSNYSNYSDYSSYNNTTSCGNSWSSNNCYIINNDYCNNSTVTGRVNSVLYNETAGTNGGKINVIASAYSSCNPDSLTPINVGVTVYDRNNKILNNSAISTTVTNQSCVNLHDGCQNINFNIDIADARNNDYRVYLSFSQDGSYFSNSGKEVVSDYRFNNNNNYYNNSYSSSNDIWCTFSCQFRHSSDNNYDYTGYSTGYSTYTPTYDNSVWSTPSYNTNDYNNSYISTNNNYNSSDCFWSCF